MVQDEKDEGSGRRMCKARNEVRKVVKGKVSEEQSG